MSKRRAFGATPVRRTRGAQENEVLLKILCHNIRCLIHEMHGLGITPNFPQLGGPETQMSA
jgi:hypothetical protein